MKAAIFDNEWILVKNDWDLVDKQISESLDVPLYTGKETKQKFRLHDKGPNNPLYQWNRGQISFDDMWGPVLEQEYGLPATSENKKLISSALELLTTDVNEDMVQLVTDLKKADVPLFILSNSTEEIYQGNRNRNDYFSLFNAVYMSFMTGFRKPEAGAYLSVLTPNNLEAKDCVFIDDKDENLAGAEKIGIVPIFYKIPGAVDPLREKLKGLGFKF